MSTIKSNGVDFVDDDQKVCDLFDLAFDAVCWVEGSNVPSNDDDLQARVTDAIKHLEWTTLAVSKLDLFSSNEFVEELPTSSLKFLLLPAFLGWLTNKKPLEGGMVGRKRLVIMTTTYLRDFLTRLNDYGVTTAPLPKKTDTELSNGVRPGGPPDLRALNADRDAKIRRFKEGQERDERLKALTLRRKEGDVNEEEERQFWLETLDKWAVQSLDDLKCLEEEEKILTFMEQRGGEKEEVVEKKPSSNPFAGRPFIIARNELQKQVFGMGYPSIPTMTVEEWYEDQVAQGLLPTPDQSQQQMQNTVKSNNPKFREEEDERKKAEEEEAEERDDEETRAKKIEWDDWKDTHRRGWGNRQNMG